MIHTGFGNTRLMLSRVLVVLSFLGLSARHGAAQGRVAYFADGFHGGVYGHYPSGQTRFMLQMLEKHPDWKINLEIEPPTWDSVKGNDPWAYQQFAGILNDPNMRCRVEYVNPSYAQSYLWNISGESIIRQFYYGIQTLRRHFPRLTFSAYSSEEPCFTSCLPGILGSFGIRYAVLKNPDTDWGGYMAAHGGQLVKWVGPDGTSMLTVPRYECEALKPGSTWQTIAWDNSQDYVNACFKDGITAPVGMCYQDALWDRGWGGGPWLGGAIKRYHHPSEYVTWSSYVRSVAGSTPWPAWRISQEDVRVSLMWGSQVLQQIATEVRYAENRLILAEKMAALAHLYAKSPLPGPALDAAWKTLLLSQHHDCWITPYNHSWGSKQTWFQHVRVWTGYSVKTADSIIRASALQLSGEENRGTDSMFVHVFNGSGFARRELVSTPVPAGWQQVTAISLATGKIIPTQLVQDSGRNPRSVLLQVSVPPMGYNVYSLVPRAAVLRRGADVRKTPDGSYHLETDQYRMMIDPGKGGTIKSLVAKRMGGKEFVDTSSARSFGELRGNFFQDGGFRSSTESPAAVQIVEKGPLRIVVRIAGTIAGQSCFRTIQLDQGDPLIRITDSMDWKGSPPIGEYPQADKASNPRKGYYDDRFKLLTLFPLNLIGRRVSKDAPFDVCESRLQNTFFNRWDSIKNNILLHWVDVTDSAGCFGMALYSDHTTSYVQGQNFPLGLTMQYSGHGLWGLDYSLRGPSVTRYALLPHAGTWDKAGVQAANIRWNEPLLTFANARRPDSRSLRRAFVRFSREGWEISSFSSPEGHLQLRIYNASGDDRPCQMAFDGIVDSMALVRLDGRLIRPLKTERDGNGSTTVTLSIPRFGIRTLRLSGYHPSFRRMAHGGQKK